MRWMESLLIMAPLPLFAVHLAHLWDRDAYRFFPLLLLAAGFLVYRLTARYGVVAVEHRTILARFVLVLGLLLTFASVLMASSWLAAAAMFLMVGGVSSRVGGDTFRKHLLPVWWLLWLLLPPPIGFDRLIVQWYDEGVRQVAETILNCAGAVHWLAGSMLKTPDRQFVLPFGFARFVTPFAAVAFAAVVAVWRRRSFLHAIALMASAAWWLFACEVAGILAIAAFYRLWGIDLTSSRLSIVASGGMLGMAVLLTLSTDIVLQPLAFTTAALKSAAFHGWQAVTWRFRRKPNRTQPAKVDRIAESPSTEPAEAAPKCDRVSHPVVAKSVGVICGILVCVQVVLVVMAPNGSVGTATEAAGIAGVGKLLPREIGGWEMKADSPGGGASAASAQGHWRFVSADSTIELSLAAASGEIEDVTADCCRDGWNVYRRKDWLTRPLRRGVRVPQIEVDVINSAGEAAWIVSGAADSRGVPRSRFRAAVRTAWHKTPAAALLRYAGTIPSGAAPLLELQFFVKAEEPLSPQQREAVRDAYRQLLENIQRQRSEESPMQNGGHAEAVADGQSG